MKNRYFYHFGYYDCKYHIVDNWVSTSKLIEVTKDYYNHSLLPLEEKIIKKCNVHGWNYPVIFENVPENLLIRKSL